MPWIYYHTDQFPPMTQADKENNVEIIWNVLGGYGYSPEAVAAICGNMEYEGILNPEQYEIGFNYDIYTGGAGLCGWTPVYVNYTDMQHLGNWCDAQGLDWLDGYSQLEYLNYELTDWDGTERFFGNGQAPSIGYPVTPPITAQEFMTSGDDPYTLAVYWELYYEHPASVSEYNLRGVAAEKWYEYILTLPTPGPVPTFSRKTKRFPFWLFI